MTTTIPPSPTAVLEQFLVPPIDRIDFVTVRLPFVNPFGTSVHVWTDKPALLLRAWPWCSGSHNRERAAHPARLPAQRLVRAERVR